MKERRVRLTATANRHIERERAWWIKNRDHQELFATALESAVKILAVLPFAGTPYIRTELPSGRLTAARSAREEFITRGSNAARDGVLDGHR